MLNKRKKTDVTEDLRKKVRNISVGIIFWMKTNGISFDNDK